MTVTRTCRILCLLLCLLVSRRSIYLTQFTYFLSFHPSNNSYRRLVDMLNPENEAFITFQPGHKQNGTKAQQLGRIIIHDRLKVEADILPQYFNHSSFASLRRQLNYFKFERLGKGRQGCATYCNEHVIELEDILHLKRRPHVSGTGAKPYKGKSSQGVPKHIKTSTLSVIKTPSSASSTGKPKVVTPRLSPVNLSADQEPKITLDLTLPSTSYANDDVQQYSLASWYASRTGESTPTNTVHSPSRYEPEDDLMEGCKALLCFSKGHHFQQNNFGQTV
jgi:hypothetical protein